MKQKAKNNLPKGHPLVSSKQVKVALRAISVCIICGIGAFICSFITGSLAALVLGLISVSNILYSLIIVSAVNQSARSPELNFNFGYGKHENLGLLIKGAFALSIFIFSIARASININFVVELNRLFIPAVFFASAFMICYWLISGLKTTGRKTDNRILIENAIFWKLQANIFLISSAIFVIMFLINSYLKAGTDYYLDFSLAIAVSAIYLYIPLRKIKDSFNQLLDRTLPEEVQFEILAVISENIHRICEFKTVRSRKSGENIFIELDLVLPYDFTLESCYNIEKDLSTELRKKYPNAITRIYIVPCDRHCIYAGKSSCPIKTDLD